MSEFDVTLNGQETSVTLQDILDFDLTSVEENSGEFPRLPRGKYRFKVLNANMEALGDAPAVKFEVEVLHCFGLISADDAELDPASLHGTKTQFPIFLSDVGKGLGQVRWIMQHSGFQPVPGVPLQTNLDAYCGTIFDAVVIWQKNKNDVDKPFVKLDMKSITPPQEQ